MYESWENERKWKGMSVRRYTTFAVVMCAGMQARRVYHASLIPQNVYPFPFLHALSIYVCMYEYMQL